MGDEDLQSLTAPKIGARSHFWISQASALARPGNLLTIVTGAGILTVWIASNNTGGGRIVSLLTVGLALMGAAPIFAGAVRGLFQRRSNVDELVSIAVIAALIGGEALAAAVVAFMMNFGKMLEDIAEHASGNAVSGLLELTPVVARVKTKTGYRSVPASVVSRGDIVLVREGERAPVDGRVITGSASIDQSGITGESVPVRREIGDRIYAGTVNVEGVVEIRATETGESTMVSRIVELVEAAKKRPAPVERLAERYARYFTPAILLIAGIILLITQDWRKAITVLIVACPCSLVLATPTALVAGIARAAISGILVRGGDVIEALSRVTIVAFDKTGTITQGHPRVEEVVTLRSGDERHIIELAASAEMLSSHPLSRAFQDYARENSIATRSPSDFEAVPGRGVVATVSGETVTVGSHYLLEDPATPAAARPAARALRARGLTCLTVGIDGDPAALVATRDSLRPGTRDLIAELAREGIQRTVLLTGDNDAVASLIAREAGISEVHANLLPSEKLAKIESYQALGENVLMVGDGVNDAPALVRADLGMAMAHEGSDIAIESADFALLSNDITRIAGAIRLGKRSMSVIKFNIAFSIALNIAAIAVAGLGGLSPMGAAIVHNAGSVFVMMNAALLAARRV